MRNISDKNSRENQNTDIRVIIFVFENSTFYEIMWENIVQPDRPPMKIWLMLFPCQITKATNTNTEHLIISIFYTMCIA